MSLERSKLFAVSTMYPDWLSPSGNGFVINKGDRAGIVLEPSDVSDLVVNEDIYHGLVSEISVLECEMLLRSYPALLFGVGGSA